MDLKQLNSVSPLRVFEDSINGGLGKGNLGVIVSKSTEKLSTITLLTMQTKYMSRFFPTE